MEKSGAMLLVGTWQCKNNKLVESFDSLWRRANARNVSFQFRSIGGQFTLVINSADKSKSIVVSLVF